MKVHLQFWIFCDFFSDAAGGVLSLISNKDETGIRFPDLAHLLHTIKIIINCGNNNSNKVLTTSDDEVMSVFYLTGTW